MKNFTIVTLALTLLIGISATKEISPASTNDITPTGFGYVNG